jgi:hypothetical protein
MFLLFAGSEYYPSGGWHDLVGAFSTMEEAMTYYDEKLKHYGWAHVVEISFRRLVATYRYDEGWVLQ